ncbi:MAG: hypothetical protein ABWJ98_03815 [Hydrogenothermaceae bacterium]
MNLLKLLTIGLIILILQSSIIPRFLNVNLLPDFIFVYLLLTLMYANYHFLQFIVISLILGISVDSISGLYPVFDTIIFPLTVIVFYLVKNKIFISNFILKLIIFILFSIISFFAKSILIYFYTGIFTIAVNDIYYITVSNTSILYLFYYIREFLYGRVFEK